MKRFFKNIIILILALSLIISCKSKPEVITKDSEPYRDFGTPLVGHYVNKEYGKGIAYTVSTLVFFLASILFAPVRDDGSPLIPIDKEIARPLSASLFGVGASIALIASPIDTSISYHIRNKKIIDLNQIQWSPKGNITKYDAINAFREKLKKERIEALRKKFQDETITEEEVLAVWNDEELTEALKDELDKYRRKQIELKMQKENEKDKKLSVDNNQENKNEKKYQDKSKEELEKELEELKKILEEKRRMEEKK